MNKEGVSKAIATALNIPLVIMVAKGVITLDEYVKLSETITDMEPGVSQEELITKIMEVFE